MKTPFAQIFIIVIFFSLSIGTTLAISWGVTNVLFNPEQKKQVHDVDIKQVKSVKNIHSSIQLLMPKLK